MKTKTKRKAAPKKKAEQFTTKEAIKYLRKFFNKSTEKESGKLWDILSALRGPDVPDNYGNKDATTSVIRYAFLGGYCPNVERMATIEPDDETRLKTRNRYEIRDEVGGHFYRHTQLAFEALGLDFDKVN